MATVAGEQIELVQEDGENLDSDWHRLEIGLLVELVHCGWQPPSAYFMGGNMFIYFSAQQARNRDFPGPDFFLVKNVSSHIRPYWVTWKEGGRFPDLVIELLSPSTRHEDLIVKKPIYETVFKTPDYFCYDPDRNELLGWRLTQGRYEPLVPNDQGWLWCQELAFWLGPWAGEYMGKHSVWLRFFDAQGTVVPTLAEFGRRQTQAAEEKTRTAEEIAAAERRRAEAAEAELARLNAQFPQQS